MSFDSSRSQQASSRNCFQGNCGIEDHGTGRSIHVWLGHFEGVLDQTDVGRFLGVVRQDDLDDVETEPLNEINVQIQQRIANRDPVAYSAASVYAACMKLRHAITLAESQGSEVLKGYLAKLVAEGTGSGGSKASQGLVKDQSFRDLFEQSLTWKQELHPKPEITLHLVQEQLDAHPDSRIIIFATYRDTVQLMVDYLIKNNIPCERFVGQATKDSEKGLSQKKQIAALTRFRQGREDRERFGAPEGDLDARSMSPAWRAVMFEMAERTRALFDEGRAVADGLEGRLRYELRLTWLGGVRVLERLERSGFDVFTSRPQLGPVDVPALVWNTVSWSRPRAA